MHTIQPDDEPNTGRVRKIVDEKISTLNRRSADKVWGMIQPVAIYLICGLLASSAILFRVVVIHGWEIDDIYKKIIRLEEKMDKGETTANKVAAIEARKDEFNYWRDATDRRISDLATFIINREKTKDTK